jgi:hypothetical protein
MKQNNNRVALVTGANKGIGFEIARGLEDGPTGGFFSQRWPRALVKTLCLTFRTGIVQP